MAPERDPECCTDEESEVLSGLCHSATHRASGLPTTPDLVQGCSVLATKAAANPQGPWQGKARPPPSTGAKREPEHPEATQAVWPAGPGPHWALGALSRAGGTYLSHGQGGESLTGHTVDGAERPQHAHRPDGREAHVVSIQRVLHHAGGGGEWAQGVARCSGVKAGTAGTRLSAEHPAS